MLCAEPAAGREQGSGEWRAAAEVLGRDLAELAPRAAVEAGPGPVRAVLALGHPRPADGSRRSCGRAASSAGAAAPRSG